MLGFGECSRALVHQQSEGLGLGCVDVCCERRKRRSRGIQGLRKSARGAHWVALIFVVRALSVPWMHWDACAWTGNTLWPKYVVNHEFICDAQATKWCRQ